MRKGAEKIATIRDVAERAGVSVATVSRLLNGEGSVRASTAARVRAAIEELRYTPNLLGRNLRQGATHKIIVLLNTLSNQFYSRVVKGIEEAARKRSYTVMVCMTHGDRELEESYLNLLKNRLVDGAVLLSVEQDGGVLSKALAGFPAVQACEPQAGFDAPSVSIDNEQAAYEAACYLLDKGHRRIAFLRGGLHLSLLPPARGRISPGARRTRPSPAARMGARRGVQRERRAAGGPMPFGAGGAADGDVLYFRQRRRGGYSRLWRAGGRRSPGPIGHGV